MRALILLPLFTGLACALSQPKTNQPKDNNYKYPGVCVFSRSAKTFIFVTQPLDPSSRLNYTDLEFVNKGPCPLPANTRKLNLENLKKSNGKKSNKPKESRRGSKNMPQKRLKLISLGEFFAPLDKILGLKEEPTTTTAKA